MRNTLIASTVLVLGAAAVMTGAANASTQPATSATTITVVSGEVVKEKARGLVSQVREQALDSTGDQVGKIRWNCANGADWHCTVVYSLRGKGTLVATGIFAGFDGETLAITGGTGAFASASGQVVLSVDGEAFTHHIELVK